jgi:hypothetical protein
MHLLLAKALERVATFFWTISSFFQSLSLKVLGRGLRCHHGKHPSVLCDVCDKERQ